MQIRCVIVTERKRVNWHSYWIPGTDGSLDEIIFAHNIPLVALEWNSTPTSAVFLLSDFTRSQSFVGNLVKRVKHIFLSIIHDILCFRGETIQLYLCKWVSLCSDIICRLKDASSLLSEPESNDVMNWDSNRKRQFPRCTWNYRGHWTGEGKLRLEGETIRNWGTFKCFLSYNI